MSQTQLDLFRRRCRQFRGLAWFLIGSMGLVVLVQAMSILVGIAGTAGGEASMLQPDLVVSLLLSMVSPACYLYAVWVIGQAMGALAKGDLFQPVLAKALRRAGIALGIGGLFSVFVMTNLMRLFGVIDGGYLNFDVSAMTLGMFGGVLFLLGTLVEEARRTQAELDEMI
ncbi:DUF2975 domain-containing protein [Brevundimonas aveniformis]|uniref:DUF2975 domain-containing protein n=1 Tax=Brevundimonas aveniformis TaxID=370977 RepID=UPI0003FBBB4C|nr:DUF2975 domain-containing protein [Brevundimonas aveniformis]